MNAKRLANLRRLLQPRHMAIVGGRSAMAAIEICRQSGFGGHIWPVHPSYETLAGLPVYASVSALPEAPDATFLLIGRSHVKEVIAELAAIDAGGVICHAAGYSELASAGESYARALHEVAGDLLLYTFCSTGLWSCVFGYSKLTHCCAVG